MHLSRLWGLGCVGTLCLMVALAVGPAMAASPPLRFETRLSCVAFDTTTRSVVVGDGRVEVTLDGRMMSVSGNFSGLSAPATAARVFSGALVGVPGKPLFNLTVSPATSGGLSGTVKLDAAQAAALRGERFYIQIDTAQAPDGALWGWLMPSHPVPQPDVPEKGPWFLQ